VCDSCSGCSACGSCSSCSSCGGGCPSCASGSGCSSCGAAPVVTQAVYEQPAAGCSSCAQGQAAPVQSTFAAPAPSTYDRQPTLAPAQSTAPQSTSRETLKPDPAPAIDNGPIMQPQPQKGPADAGSTNLEAPRLLSPQDRTAQRNAAPVWTAVYNKPASGKTVIQAVSREQAVDDASGWVSASK
jgi:hypothetical protein